MSDGNVESNTHCPDCGRQLPSVEEMRAAWRSAAVVGCVEEATEADELAFYHESDCEVAKERDLISGLRQAVYH